MRRSAACSRASPRAAASLAARSAVTAARIIEVSAATPTNSCVASRLSVSELRTNGPVPFDVSQMVINVAARSAAAAPRGPKRSAAQISAGKITYGTSWCEARSVRPSRTRISAAPSAIWRLVRRTRVFAQVSTAGVTTSAPARVGQPPGAPDALGSQRRQIARDPDRQNAETGAQRRAGRGACHQDEHVPDPQAWSARPETDEQRGRHDHRDHRAERLAERDAERRRVVACQQVADHDGRPQPQPEQNECCDADADGWPEGGHDAVGARARVRIGEVDPDLRGCVVRGHRHDGGQQIAPLDQPRCHAGQPFSHRPVGCSRPLGAVVGGEASRTRRGSRV